MNIEQAFPFPSARSVSLKSDKDQLDVVREIMDKYDQGYETVLLDSPTGTGKSAMLTTVCNMMDSAFYTTPQRSLREQLGEDDVLSQHYETLKARSDYMCMSPISTNGDNEEPMFNCSNCPVNRDSDTSCTDQRNCTYWSAKERAMGAQTAVVTFAMLTFDNYIPEYVKYNSGLGERKVSFGNRDLLAVDEMQSLEGQTAGMFAGYTVSENTLPGQVTHNHLNDVDFSVESYQEVKELLHSMKKDAEHFITTSGNQVGQRMKSEEESKIVRQCRNFITKVEYTQRETEEGREWVADLNMTTRYDGERIKKLELKPVLVDKFLHDFIWSRADKHLLATATMPFRSDPEELCNRLGLDWSKTAVVTVDMPFPKENRPTHLDFVGSMSSGGDEELWDDVVQKIQDIAKSHKGEAGVIHTVSYKRVKMLKESMGITKYPSLFENIYFHEQEMGAEEVIEDWRNSHENILASPAVTEGVDLHDDLCRFGIMLKVPYPYLGDNRTKTLLYKMNQNQWYAEETLTDIVQAAGRGVRHDEDYCDFYILDSKWDSLTRDVELPPWFQETIQ